MFNLNQSVDNWCKTIGKNRCRQKGNIDELKDHLYCEIEALVSDEINEEQAFYLAIEQVGDIEALRGEYQKNRTVFEKLNSNQQAEMFDEIIAGSEKMTTKFLKKLVIGNAVLWATAMLATAIVLRGSEEGQTVLILLIGLWVASSFLFGGMKNVAKTECEFLRSKFKSKT